MNIILTENNKSIEEFDLLSRFHSQEEVSQGKEKDNLYEEKLLIEKNKDNLKMYFVDDPKVCCERCIHIYQIEKDCDLYIEILENINREIVNSYPPFVSFEKCCEQCRDEEASYYDLALLADEMIEYTAASKKWYHNKVSIEKRWNISKLDIKNKAIELREKIIYVHQVN